MTALRILFVDDEPNVLAGLRRMLHPLREEWASSFASSGIEALDLMKRAPFDVVVSDMRMPEMNGAELLAEVRRLYPKTIRFVLSGQSDRETMLRAIGTTHQFLSKPCDAEMLRAAIRRASALRDLLRDADLVRLVSQIPSIPTLPEVFLRLQDALRSEDPSLREVGEIIERDVGLSAKVLQLVNSALFGLRQPASSPSQAVSLLGIDVVRTLALLAHVFDRADDPGLPGLSIEALQAHSLAVGASARAIARREDGSKAQCDECFMAGVLHDAGLLVLLTSRPEDYRHVFEMTRSGTRPLVEAERAVFGAGHAEVGAYMLGIWGLPDAIVEATAFHHEPGRSAGSSLTTLTAIHVADAFEHESGHGDLGARATVLDLEYLRGLGLESHLEAWRQACSRLALGPGEA